MAGTPNLGRGAVLKEENDRVADKCGLKPSKALVQILFDFLAESSGITLEAE
jgi:antitoxin component of RelBE/YafQ-DinJ toxin-antitoxin module